MRTTPAAWTIAMLVLASPAAASVIHGTLRMDTRATARVASTEGSTGAPVAQRGVTDAVVYLESIPDKVERKLAHPRSWFFGRPKEPGILHIIQANRQFKPRVAAVAAGGRVEFKNMDRVYHSTFSVSSAKR